MGAVHGAVGHAPDDALLSVRGLSVATRGAGGRHGVAVTRNVSIDLAPGERVGLVGESGCGKTATGLAILDLLPQGLVRASGSVLFRGDDLASMRERDLNKVRGRRVSMIFQEPMSALDPVFTIGAQISETIRAHFRVGAREARERAIAALDAVGIPLPRQRFDEYPHHLSGGMRQRAMIAIATVCGPDVLIADEATTALDVTIQAQIVELLVRLSEDNRMALLFISHDLGVVSEACSRLVTMYAGEVVEDAPIGRALEQPRHPYTAGLLGAMPGSQRGLRRLAPIPGRVPTPRAMPSGCRFAPRCAFVIPECNGPVELQPSKAGGLVRCLRRDELTLTGVGEWSGPEDAGDVPRTPGASERLAHEILVRVENVTVHFDRGKGKAPLRAIDGVSFDVSAGETLGIIGESGSGKSTLARALVQLQRLTAGCITLSDIDPTTLSAAELREFRQNFQIIFQDPRAALNPRMTIGALIAEPLEIQGIGTSEGREARVRELLETVELGPDYYSRYPHQLSGGQRQRVNIARALAVRPKLLVCDEVVAALDVSIQAGILNLFKDLQEEFGLTYVFITHDLGVAAYLSDRIAVMYLGCIVEMGTRAQVIGSPLHPYTRALMETAPEAVPASQRAAKVPLQGEIPSPLAPPSGCRFRTRCPMALDICAVQVPEWREFRPAQFVACHRAEEMAAASVVTGAPVSGRPAVQMSVRP